MKIAHLFDVKSSGSKAFIILSIVVLLFGLSQCHKCQTTCYQQCLSYWTDSTRTTMDTICAQNFNTYKDYEEFIGNKVGYYVHEPEFKECKATAAQLKNATCN